MTKALKGQYVCIMYAVVSSTFDRLLKFDLKCDKYYKKHIHIV